MCGWLCHAAHLTLTMCSSYGVDDPVRTSSIEVWKTHRMTMWAIVVDEKANRLLIQVTSKFSWYSLHWMFPVKRFVLPWLKYVVWGRKSIVLDTEAKHYSLRLQEREEKVNVQVMLWFDEVLFLWIFKSSCEGSDKTYVSSQIFSYHISDETVAKWKWFH